MSAKAGFVLDTYHTKIYHVSSGKIGNAHYLLVRLSILVPRIVLTSCA